ncbi:MAG: twin transmembrane helix small protein [Micavibrio sp.]
MSTIFFILMIMSMLAVVATLVAGLTVMSKGGDLNKKYGNRLMQARIMFQGLAIGFFILAMLAGKA